jgi:hypothetical protein
MPINSDSNGNSADFFHVIFGNEPINFNCIQYGTGKPSWPPINGLFNEYTIKILEQYNRHNYEIYFVVNSGGYRDEHISKINAVFIDLDCPKVKGQKPPLIDVKKFKEQSKKAIRDFSYKPSIINESRNGYHVYWLLHEGATVEQFRDCQARLVQHFDADPKVQKPCNLMRVPGFYWCKDPNNKYLVEVIEMNNVRYHIEDIIDALPSGYNDNEVIGTHNKNKSNTLVSIVGTKQDEDNPNTNTALIRLRNIEALQSILQPQPITLNSHDEVVDYLKKQPLQTFLGVNGVHFKCTCHDDKNPSATIFANADTGHHIYKCHSGECGVTGTIFDVVQQLTEMDFIETARFLRKVFRIEYAETEWQRNRKSVLDENQSLIASDEFAEQDPEIIRLIKNYLPLLSKLNEIAKNHITTNTFTDIHGNPVFFVSIRTLATEWKKDVKSTGKILGVFTFLGLVKKIPEDDIPTHMLRRAKREQAKHGLAYRVGFYSIPKYEETVLVFATDKARLFKEKHFTIKGWGREMLLGSLGEAEADRVFPQMKGKPIPALNEEVTVQMERVAMEIISAKGWAYESEILEHIKLMRFRGQKEFKERQFKRMLPDMLDKYLLVRIPLNRELKQRFGIVRKGHPYIIMRE